MLHQGRTKAGGAAGRHAVPHLVAKARKHRAAGRRAEAREALSSILAIDPHHPEAHYEAGLLGEAGSRDAVQHFTAALRGAPDQPRYWLALATSLLAEERLAEARAILERYRACRFATSTAAMEKAFVDRTFAVAQERYDADKLPEAEALLDLVILMDSNHAGATYYAGVAAARTNRLDLAYDLISIAIYREPKNALFFTGLGSLLNTRMDSAGAISALEKAIELDGSLALAHNNIAGVYQNCSQHGRALHYADKAVALNPAYAGAHGIRGSALLSLGRIAEAIEAYEQALTVDPQQVHIASNRLFAKLYAPHIPHEEYVGDAIAFGRRYADPLLRRRPFANDRDADRRLRIGFVSGDLCSHAVVRFFEPFLTGVGRTDLELVAYMTRAREDHVSDRLRPRFDLWRNIYGLSDDEAADQIEADRIDILVDLSGHSGGNRLMVFARKPAPVQVTWIGHPGTTGLTAIDYRLTDGLHDPADADGHYSEVLWRLPRVGGIYSGRVNLPDIRSQALCQERGHVTFGCFNRLTKVGDGVLAAWARIMAAVPDARMFMVVADIDNPEVRGAVETRLAGAGIPLDRLEFHPRADGDYYHLYHRVDIALDPYPYNGGTTSYDTLSMGVPYVTLRGGHAAARTGAAVLDAIGVPDLIAADEDAYVTIATNLANDRDRLLRLRTELRGRLSASPLMDHEGVAGEIGEAFRAMWRRWLSDDTTPGR